MLNLKIYDGARVLEASDRLMVVIERNIARGQPLDTAAPWTPNAADATDCAISTTASTVGPTVSLAAPCHRCHPRKQAQ